MVEIEVRDNQALEDLVKKVDYVKMEDYYFPTKFALKFPKYYKCKPNYGRKSTYSKDYMGGI